MDDFHSLLRTFSERYPRLSKFVKGLISGGTAGAISKTCTAPIERVKVLLQGQALAKKNHQQYSGILDALYRIPREQGVSALWRGNTLSVIRIVPSSAIKFACYDRIKEFCFPRPASEYSHTESFCRKLAAGTISGCITQALTYPLDFARTRLALDLSGKGETRRYKGFLDCCRKVVRDEGPLALYKGFYVSLFIYGPYLGLSFSLYDTFKLLLPEKDSTKQYAFYQMLAGASAGVVAKTVTFPFDTVRIRMQMNGGGGEARQYDNATHCARVMLRTEGARSFYRGCWANILRTIPGSAIQFFAFDTIKAFLR